MIEDAAKSGIPRLSMQLLKPAKVLILVVGLHVVRARAGGVLLRDANLVFGQLLAVLRHELASVLHAGAPFGLSTGRQVERGARSKLVRYVGAETGQLLVRLVAFHGRLRVTILWLLRRSSMSALTNG